MTDIRITTPDDSLVNLRERAAAYGISHEELVRVSIEHSLEAPGEEFERAMDYVLKKNEELYRRPA